VAKQEVDKSEWPSGVWHTEPDEHHWEHAGFKCMVLRPRLGHLCGYIGVEEGHPLYGVSYDDVYKQHGVRVHGGLTFSDQYEWLGNTWWIGFDCAHLGDLSPGCKPYGSFDGDKYRDFGWVITETERLAEQLQETNK